VTGIADTGFLLAFWNRLDRYHNWAAEVAASVTGPLLTCEAVLAEAAYILRDSQSVLEWIDTGLVVAAFDVASNVDQLLEAAERFADRQPDLADLCLIRMSELHPRLPVITVDVSDFRVYRRNRNEAIPLIVPTGL
jgi:uncharacterized protein